MRRIAAMLLAAMLAACASAAPDLPAPAAIDVEARRLMAAEDVKGMALALIDEGRIAHVAAYGARNVEKGLPLEEDTVMYGASLTKAAFGYMVLQLVEEGRFDLDRPLASYLKRPLPQYPDYTDLEGDPRWERLTARHVLTHSTGFANFRWLEEDGVLRFHFEPGTRYAYSGEGFYILQLALEEGLGLDVGAEMQQRLFDATGLTRTSMQWRADFADNLADGYAIDGSFEPHDERSRASAAGSMDTTIADQARLWAAMIAGEGLSPAMRAAWTSPQLAIASAHQFPTLRPWTDARNADIGLSAGLGLVVFEDPSRGRMLFKGGHNDWTGNMAICEERRRRCLILLANSVRAELIYEDLARFVLGETAMPWRWEYYRGE